MKRIRESKFSKALAWYLLIMIFLEAAGSTGVYAATSGPTQPEFNSFTPIGTSDMVDLASGDFNYNIPVMDVGGYPLNLSYSPGITMDQEASWVGLGWNLNVGQIERQVRGLPDDFRGDIVTYENDVRDNVTVGMNLAANVAAFGWDGVSLGAGLGVESNNYEGISFRPSFGVGFQLSDNVSVGLNLSSSVAEGASVSPNVSISAKSNDYQNGPVYGLKSSLSLGLNSRKGVENLNLSASVSRTDNDVMFNDKGEATGSSQHRTSQGLGSLSGSISFNNQSFTPSKRIGYENTNFTFSAAVGGEVFGIEGQAQVTGYGAYQKIHPDYKIRNEKAFGYENTHYKKEQSGVLDFNRENERTITENTLALPVTNYTYDIYNIQGQGVSGMFRPYRSQVSSLYNDYVVDNGDSKSFGVELGLGQLIHGSGDFKTTPSISWTGPWVKNNNVLPYFSERDTDKNLLNYEPVSYKLVGSMVIDPEQAIYNNRIWEAKAIRVGITGANKNGSTTKFFHDKSNASLGISSPIKRTKRFLRNQLVHKVTAKEAVGDPFVSANTFAKPHHTAGIKVLQMDGTTYVYGKTAYNTKKVEATFDVSGSTYSNSNVTGEIGYNGTVRNNHSNSKRSDKFLNKITTRGYAHSYLITSVLSSDYEDVDGNGPSQNDLGSYTQFDYDSTSDYRWRVPFNEKKVTYNAGLISKNNDQKGNYLYGEKELVYLKKIVTKTHVAFFDLEERKDAIGVKSINPEEGGAGTGSKRMKKIKSIRLYSRPEVTGANGVITDPGANGAIKPIKTAHFIYSYKLCQKVPNNEKQCGSTTALTTSEISNDGGKLTLEKVYFTYRGSNMGKYTPYVFNYNVNNPEYNAKNFDIWGNYKANGNVGSGSINDLPTTTEFPFVEQLKSTVDTNAQSTADTNTSSWNLSQIKLPSGGEINIETESDDYQFVQNKKAMQMFQVIGCRDQANSPIDNKLYHGNGHKKFLYVKVSDQQLSDVDGDLDYDQQDFIQQYLSENYDKAIQFRFLLNMRGDNNWQYENVQGYFKIDKNTQIDITSSTNGTFASIPMAFLKRDGGTNPGALVNPIAKAGWGFGRTYLNRVVYGLDDDPGEEDFETIVNNLVGSIEAIGEIFTGPNLALQNNGCAREFKPAKSWIRLENPYGKKLGGGLRVKSVKLRDNWNSMLGNSGGTDLSSMEYGQVYSYADEHGKSSGVATFEPNGSSENALVEPFYNNQGGFADNIAAPRESNYVELPFGENFYPSPRVTYSKVTVKNIDREDDNNRVVRKHATGTVVTEHFTSRDFPTKVEYTDIGIIPDITPNNIIGQLIQSPDVRIRNHLTMSQGYSIETNDMNGKVKSQTIYDEGQNEISKVVYNYNTDSDNNLDNNLLTINSKGEIEKRLVGLDYDLINDFNENFSSTHAKGIDANLAAFIIPTAPVPFPMFVPTTFPKSSYHENQLRTAVTVKHIHKTGILKEKIATDLGSTVATKNLAWDANSGEVLLTETINEYNDKYYSFTYPAYWKYESMGLASSNIGITGTLKSFVPISNPSSSSNPSASPYFYVNDIGNTALLSDYFQLGDELLVDLDQNQDLNPDTILDTRLWVVGFTADKKGIMLMDKAGNYFNKCEDYSKIPFKIVRSGYRNLQTASMASVTSMQNPLINLNDGSPKTELGPELYLFNLGINYPQTLNPRIVNSSAVVYKDFWLPQIENGAPYYPDYVDLGNNSPVDEAGNPKYPFAVGVNPYVWNIKGDWKAEKSYAYLTGRNAGNGVINNPRKEGFYTKFSPFYQVHNGVWNIDDTGWTYASSITQFSPFGAELENKDALNRYSSAQYGYKYTLPMAVASNSKYSQMGYEGFEETFLDNLGVNRHFGFQVDQNAISTSHSHTGKKSIKVSNSEPVVLSNGLLPFSGNVPKAFCPTSVPPGGVETCYQSILLGIGSGCPGGKSAQLTFASTITLGQTQGPPDLFISVTRSGANNHIMTICVMGYQNSMSNVTIYIPYTINGQSGTISAQIHETGSGNGTNLLIDCIANSGEQ